MSKNMNKKKIYASVPYVVSNAVASILHVPYVRYELSRRFYSVIHRIRAEIVHLLGTAMACRIKIQVQ